MATDPNNSSKSNAEEIDLSALFSVIGDFFKRIYLGFIHLLIATRNLILKYKYSFIVAIVIGGVAGFFFKKVQPPLYASSMVVNSQFFRGSLLDNSFGKLNRLCKESNHLEVAKYLGIDSLDASKIKQFILTPVLSEAEQRRIGFLLSQIDPSDNPEEYQRLQAKISFENQTTYKVRVLAFDPTVFPLLDSAIINFITSNEFVRKRIEISEQNLNLKLAKIQEEAVKLDSLKNLIALNYLMATQQSERGNNNVYVGSESSVTNPLSVYQEDFRLFEEELGVKRQIFLQSEIEVIDGFANFVEPYSESRITYTLLGVAVTIGLVFLFALLKNLNSYLNQMEAERKEVA